jgi:hypothetical protein
MSKSIIDPISPLVRCGPVGDLTLLVPVHVEPWPARLDVLPRAVRELPHRGSGPAERHCDLSVIEAEHLV